MPKPKTMKGLLLILTCIVFTADYFAQELPPPPSNKAPKNQDTTVVDFPDIEASYKGGAEAMQRYINSNVNYPLKAIVKNIEGKVYVTFIVETDGSITNVKAGKGAHKVLRKEAERVVENMPAWNPGAVGDVKVRTRCRLPIIFQLE